MKWFLFSLSMLYGQFSFGQVAYDTVKKSERQMGTYLDIRKRRQDEILAYADSINEYRSGKLPNFLLDPCFDWKRSYWPDLHTAISVRWMILEKVKDKHGLRALLRYHDNRLKQKCLVVNDAFLKVPMIDMSFYELIKKRFMQL